MPQGLCLGNSFLSILFLNVLNFKLKIYNIVQRLIFYTINEWMNDETVNCFKTRLNKFWFNQDTKYNFRSEIHGTFSLFSHCDFILYFTFLFPFSMLHVLWLKVYCVICVSVIYPLGQLLVPLWALLSCSRSTLYNYCHFSANFSKIKIDWLCYWVGQSPVNRISSACLSYCILSKI